MINIWVIILFWGLAGRYITQNICRCSCSSNGSLSFNWAKLDFKIGSEWISSLYADLFDNPIDQLIYFIRSSIKIVSKISALYMLLWIHLYANFSQPLGFLTNGSDDDLISCAFFQARIEGFETRRAVVKSTETATYSPRKVAQGLGKFFRPGSWPGSSGKLPTLHE